jgi:tetratricopeptide (TPR) repeat protein/TolB-like protein
MKCPKCGEKNAEHVNRCVKCGASIADEPTEVDLRPSQTSGAATSKSQVSKTSDSPMEVPTEYMPRQSTPSSFSSAAPITSRGTPQPSPTPISGAQRSPSQPGGRTAELPLLTLFANRYEILELIGEGGMGRVYKARDIELDRLIALKTIRTEGDPEIVQRFKKELVLARKITHKNVIRIHDLGEADAIKFFTMEYIEGESLKQRIRKRGPIPVEEAVPLIRQILSALQEAHSQGVIHRDLKPQNIMLDKNGVPFVMDFGIARAAGETSGMTATGAVIGTPDYMSPEQVRGEKAEVQSDLFSMGVIMYEMLTGDLPYKADTAVSKVMMRLTHKPRAPRELKADLPKYLENVVLKSMERDLVLRYKSAADILGDIDREQVDRSLTLRVQRAVAGRRAGIAAAAAVVVAVVAALNYRDRAAPTVPPPEGPVTTLAILPFTNATGSEQFEWMRTGLPEMLVTDIGQSHYVRPVPGERLFKVLNELGIAEQTRFDEAALESVSKMAPAQSVLYGQFVESGGLLRADMTLRKAGAGVPIPLKAEAQTGEVFALVDEITGLVKGQLDLTPAQLRGDIDRPVSEVSTASLDALRLYQSALAELQKGSNQAAIPLLRDATGRDPSFAMAYAKLAEAYMNRRERAEAEAAVDRARTLSEQRPLPLAERYQIHATAALVKEDFDTAIQSYGELAKLYPDDPDIPLALARAYDHRGKLPEAIEQYQRVVQLAPGYGDARLGLAWAQIRSGRPAEGIQSLQEVLASGQFNGNAEAMGTIHYRLGTAHRETGDLAKALEHLNQSLQFRRESGDKRLQASTLNGMGTIYRRMDQWDKALDVQKKALALARELGDRVGQSDYLISLGNTYKVSGGLDRAMDSYREAMQIDMERQDHLRLANVQNLIAQVFQLKGQYDDALVYLEQAKVHLQQTKEQREKGNNLAYIGLIRKAQGRYDLALEAFLEALPIFQDIKDDESVADVQGALADIYRRQGRYADSLKAAQQSLELYEKLKIQHHIGEQHAKLGHVYIALGRLDEASKAFDEAEKLSGGHGDSHGPGGHGGGGSPDVLFGRAEVARLRGKLDEAAAAYEQANIKANLSGEKELAVESRVELGLLYLEQGKLDNAERLLARTRQEAAQARLRPLEAEAAALLAEIQLAKGQAEAARKAAVEAISIADKFSGRPTLYKAYASLGEALEKLKRPEESIDAYAKAASTLDWIRGSLLPEHMNSFTARADVQSLIKKAVGVLEKAGRTAEAEPLKKWLAPASARSSDS